MSRPKFINPPPPDRYPTSFAAEREATEAEEAREQVERVRANDEARQRRLDAEAKAKREAEEARQAEEAKRREVALAEMKQRARSVFMANPAASEEDFERLWPQLRDQTLVDETRKADAALRAALRREYNSF